MAEDRRKNARDFTAEIKKQQDILKAHNETSLSYRQAQARIIELEKQRSELQQDIRDSIDDQVKVGKQILSIEKELDRTEKQIDKSFSSRLQSLAKGNIASALGLSFATRHESKQRELAIAHKDAQESMVDLNLSQGQQNKLLDIAAQIQRGELKDRDAITEAVRKAGGEGFKFLDILDDLVDKKEEEVKAGQESVSLADKFGKATAISAAIFAGLLAIAQRFASSVDAIGNQFGSLNVQSDEFKDSLMDAQMEVTGIGASIEDVVATTSALAGEFGISATEAADLSAQVIDTAKAVGLSNEEAAKLSGILQTTSGLSAQQAEQLTEGAFQLAVANDVAPDAVMKDLAGSAEEFASFSKDGGDNLVKAAVQARALGLSLQDTAKISEGLLNFQDSITKEVEASVLIGRQLNLQKARELALNNDIEGAMKEVVKQVGSEEEFSRLNAIQRKALADSIGVEVSQLAKLVANSEKANAVAGETAKSFQDIIGKEAMSELTATMNELKVFGVAVAQTLGPPLMALAKLVNFVLVPAGNLIAGISSSIRGGFGGASMNDGVVGAGGISVMAGPAGVFELNPRDNVLATTNPIPINDGMFGSTTGGGNGGGTNVQIESKMVKLGGGDMGLMIDAYTYPSNGQSARTNYAALTSRGE